MTSQIDPSVPVFGNPTTASVRQNFLIAKQEITALQEGGGRLPPTTINGSGMLTIPDVSDATFFIFNTSAAVITISLPNGTFINQRVLIKDSAGNAGTFNINIVPLSTIDGNSPYTLFSNYASIEIVWMGSLWGTM